MHRYFIKTPWLLRKVFSEYTWLIPSDEKNVYLSFDDGPHPTITPWVLDQLKAFNAKATFFCIGKNVEKHPDVYQRILNEGHAVGNHTYNHLNGWTTRDENYLSDIKQASVFIDSMLFRPPYGRVRKSQAKKLEEVMGREKVEVIMWDVLSGDFDQAISPAHCIRNVVGNVSAGSIVVFHDSEKAWKNLEETLPVTLEWLLGKGFVCKKIGGKSKEDGL